MSIHATVAAALMLAGAALMASSPSHAQANPCDSQAQRISCSQQCCGGRTCPPSCEAECVRACITACKDPSRSLSYQTQMSTYQKRCGNRSVR